MGFISKWTQTPTKIALASHLDAAILIQRTTHNPVGAFLVIERLITGDATFFAPELTEESAKFLSGIGRAVDAGIAAWISWIPPFGGTLSPAALQAFVTSSTSSWTGAEKATLINDCGQAIYELIFFGA